MFIYNDLVAEMDSLRKFARRLTQNPHNAEDLLQSTLLRALEKKHLFEPGTNLFRWTSKIMFNLFVSDYRRRTKFETQYDPEHYMAKLSVEPEQETKVELLKVNEAISRLSPDHREILVLVCAQSMSYETVASALDIPVGTVRSRMARARENLQKILDMPYSAVAVTQDEGSKRLSSWR
ncbi:MAG: sigma-70 family RNA polymerase sigma factor [Alphaproteobacteria bacterium]|nr:sigma-70 family RNA polymerase sigma factor [Alphaproteobacteria bacterium]